MLPTYTNDHVRSASSATIAATTSRKIVLTEKQFPSLLQIEMLNATERDLASVIDFVANCIAITFASKRTITIKSLLMAVYR